MNKYGLENDFENFIFEIIEECDYEILDEREKYWIQTLNTLEPNGYNICLGGKKLYGKDNPFYGKHHTEETKQKISSKNKGRIISEKEREMRKRINSGENNPFYGKTHSKEVKQKIREANIANGNYLKTSERMKKDNPAKKYITNERMVLMINDFDEIINIFNSITEAGNYVKRCGISCAKHPGNSIGEVCRGNQKHAYGYVWKYFNGKIINKFDEMTCCNSSFIETIEQSKIRKERDLQ